MPPVSILPRKNSRLNAYILTNEERYRPKKDKVNIDLDNVFMLSRIGATKDEMAVALGCSKQWIEKHITENPSLALAFEKGKVELLHSLRRTQIEVALNGSVPMLIWLGKQYLGQSDKQETNTKTEINITVQRAMDELRSIPKEQLLAAQALLSQPTIDNGATNEDSAIVSEAE